MNKQSKQNLKTRKSRKPAGKQAARKVFDQVSKLMVEEEKTQRGYHDREKHVIGELSPNVGKKTSFGKLKEFKSKLSAADLLSIRGGALAAPPIVNFSQAFDSTNQLATANKLGNSGPGPNVGAINVPTLRFDEPWVEAVFNGLTTGDARFPDPFTLVKTSIFQLATAVSVTPSPLVSGTEVYENAVSGIFKGSGTKTLGLHGSYAATPAFTDTIDWAPFDGSHLYGMNWYDAGSTDNYLMSRPNGMVLSIVPQLRGVAHSVTVNAFPILPALAASYTASMGGWPATLRDFTKTPNSVQLSWGARTWQFSPGDEAIKLVCLPYDSRCLDFQAANAERLAVNNGSQTAWQGWAFWVYGLGPDDLVSITVNSTEEVVRRPTTATVLPYPSSIRRTSSLILDVGWLYVA